MPPTNLFDYRLPPVSTSFLMKIIFFGSSEFSLSALRACQDAGQQIILAVTTPDQKKGRGLEMAPTPVKEYSQKAKLEVVCPENLKGEEWVRKIEALKPDLFVVSSYGKIIPTSWLKIPSQGSWNVHPSLLPKYRGAAPIHWPIINGEPETGLSIAEVTPELDAGDIFYQKRIPLDRSLDAEGLSKRLAAMSYEALLQLFFAKKKGELKRTLQDAREATYARKLEKQDGLIDWRASAGEIERKVRGLLPWPAAYFLFLNAQVQIFNAEEDSVGCSEGMPGQILDINHKNGTLRVQTGRGSLMIESVRPAGKKIMNAAEFARGKRLQPGLIFGNK